MVLNPRIITPSGDVFYLPPFDFQHSESASFRTQSVVVPGADGVLPVSQEIGARSIDISGMIIGFVVSGEPYSLSSPVSREAVQTRCKMMETALKGRFYLHIYDAVRWDDCFVENEIRFEPSRNGFTCKYSFRVICTNPTPVLVSTSSSGSGSSSGGTTIDDASNSSSGGNSPYAPITGITSSNSTSTGEALMVKQFLPIPVMFPGKPDTTTTNHKQVVYVPGSGSWKITRVAITGASGADDSGTSTLRVCTVAPGNGGVFVDVELGSSARQASATASISVSGGTFVYAWLPACVHYDISAQIVLESA